MKTAGRTTAIEWTHHTWNPFVGCSNVSEGCRFCYAEAQAFRMEGFGNPVYEGTTRKVGGRPKWTGRLFLASQATLGKIDKITSRSPLIFVNSMSDFWHENAEDGWRALVLKKIRSRPDLIFQILTKRPGNIAPMLARMGEDLPPNLWLGATVEDHRVLNRIPVLTAVPASVHFLSVEPMIAPFGQPDLAGIEWVIGGGESGPLARHCDPAWAMELRDLCAAQGKPFFWKQWGKPGNNPIYKAALAETGNVKAASSAIGSADPDGKGGSLIDGRAWKEFPSSYAGPSPASLPML